MELLYQNLVNFRTKETLASGNFLSVINVLMQLRKVCNHPDLFEPRPITSPFAMQGINYHTASLITTPLDYDPMKHVNLDALNLRFVGLSRTLSATAQHRITEYHAPSKLIEEIDSAPEPPPRIPKGKIRLQINVKPPHPPPISSAMSAHTYQLQPRTISPIQFKSVNNLPINVNCNSSPGASSHRFLLLSTNNPGMSPIRSLNASGSTGVIAMSESGNPIVGSQTASFLKKLTITKPIVTGNPVNPLANQRVKIQIGKLLQTSTGQHILVNPVQSPTPSQIVLPTVINSNQPLQTKHVPDQSNGKRIIHLAYSNNAQ